MFNLNKGVYSYNKCWEFDNGVVHLGDIVIIMKSNYEKENMKLKLKHIREILPGSNPRDLLLVNECGESKSLDSRLIESVELFDGTILSKDNSHYSCFNILTKGNEIICNHIVGKTIQITYRNILFLKSIVNCLVVACDDKYISMSIIKEDGFDRCEKIIPIKNIIHIKSIEQMKL